MNDARFHKVISHLSSYLVLTTERLLASLIHVRESRLRDGAVFQGHPAITDENQG